MCRMGLMGFMITGWGCVTFSVFNFFFFVGGARVIPRFIPLSFLFDSRSHTR